MSEKEIVFSGLQPTGKMQLGNYIGAVKNMVSMQEKYECFYSIADLHAITVDIVPANLRANTLDMLALLIAMGVDYQNHTLFVQSQVSAHSELCWTLNCFTMMGEARRMIQFKEKSAKHKDNVNVGLLDYPVLQAADILLYNASLVPVGKDQKQHVELAATIAKRFNSKYSPTFAVPKVLTPKAGAKVQSLSDPTIKMGKSNEDTSGVIFILDDKDTIMRKFKRAVTDSGREVVYSADKPGISNLITIYSIVTQKTVKEVEKEFAAASYADFKEAVGEAVAAFLGGIQNEYKRIIADKAFLTQVMNTGKEKASRAAYKMLSKVYRKVGFLQ